MNYCPECGGKLSSTDVDGVIRSVCKKNKCRFVHWNNPTPVVAALVQLDGQYVIARNSRWPRGIFSLIAGYLESGEEPESAVLREVNEELGLDGKIESYLGHYSFREKNQLILAFEVIATGELQTNHELAEVKHLTPSELTTYDFGPLYITERIVKKWAGLQ